MQKLIDLEVQGWQSLSSGGKVSKEFYSSILCENAVMLFPGDILVNGKESILQSLVAQPWKSFQIEEPQVVVLSEGARALIYRVTAQREDSAPYIALINSTYVLTNGTWKLALHQQTPV